MKAAISLPFLDYDNIRTTHDVERALHQLEFALKGTHLAPICNFNRTYWIVTKHVKYHLEQQVFLDETFIHSFDTRFAFYYFYALQNYIEGKPTTLSWHVAFEESRKGTLPPLISMALGVNAHINNDIPQALRDAEAQDLHHVDYDKVNGIIKDCILEVIEALEEDYSLRSPKRTLLKPAYRLAMYALLRRWRHNAWVNYKKLLDQTISVPDIEQSAYRVANRLTRLPL